MLQLLADKKKFPKLKEIVVAGHSSGAQFAQRYAAANRIDHLLLSPELFVKATGGGIWRLGTWGGKNGTLWPHYGTVTTATDTASDHAAIYADLTPT